MKRRTQPVTTLPAEGLNEYQDFTDQRVLERYRASLAAPNLKDGKLPAGVTTEWETINGVRAAWIRKEGADPDKLIFQIHGGGWNGGVPCTGQRAFVEMVSDLNINIVSVEYRLSPENPYPAAVEDCFAVYQGILEKGFSAQNIVFTGESAGGNLSLAVPLYARDQGLPLPGGMALIAPAVEMPDLDALKTYLEAHPEDLSQRQNYVVYSTYIGDADGTIPYLSPINADLTGLPPVLIQVGNADELYAGCAKLAYKLILSGVDTTIHCWEYMPHVFVFLQDLIPEAKAAKEELEAFISRVLS